MPSDPYKYFRIEADELLEELGRGVLELERGAVGAEVMRRMLRAAHTFKGASRVVKQNEIAEFAHAIEDVLTPHRDGDVPVSPERIQQLLGLLDSMRSAVSGLRVAVEQQADPTKQAPPLVEERFQTVRIETTDMDKLLTGVSRASTQLAALRAELVHLDEAEVMGRELASRLEAGESGRGTGASSVHAATTAENLYRALRRHHRSLEVSLSQVEREVAEMGETANALRLLPAAALFGPLERAVRDAAESERKRVGLHCFGGETRLEAHVLSAVQDALLHVVRNAVAHGIERESDRSKMGKPPEGRVELRVARDGNSIVLACTDDGRGVDVEAVRQAAVRRGVLSPTEAATRSAEELTRLILKGGISTNATPTGVSGRGIGLDVVRNAVERLHGEASVRTEPLRGTTVEMRVPFSLTGLSTVLARSGDVTCCIPMESVRDVLRLNDAGVARRAEGATMLHEGTAIPFLSLAAALDQPRGEEAQTRSVIVVEWKGKKAGIGVDRLLGLSDILLKPLPTWISAGRVIAGASLHTSGEVWLVLKPEALIAKASEAKGESPRPRAARPPVLVVDDSLTTRMLEQSILESAGYEVDVATSGEEGLMKARSRQYGVMIVDVEMPGIDGFEVLARVGQDAALREIPVLLVTSRNSAEDQRRGRELGAKAYIVKNEFDQQRLLRILQGLIG